MRTHYDNLHVSEKASPEVIKGAYKALAQKWHPDKHPNQREKAERYFKIITRAFEVLSDPETRAEYDAWLSSQRSTHQKPETEPAKESPRQSQDRGNMAKAWEDGKRSREQGFTEKDCPYNDNDLAGAWQQGFKAARPEQANMPAGVHPWRRFFARFIDTLTLGFSTAFFISFYAASTLGINLNSYFSGSLLVWAAFTTASLIITETALLHLFATTPGKWLFGIRVHANNGGNLSLKNSLERALGAQLIGQGANIPGVGLLTYSLGYIRLTRTRTTFWDTSAQSKVECVPMSGARIAICTAVTVVAMMVNSALLKAQLQETNQQNPAAAVSAAQPQPLVPQPTTPSIHEPEPSAEDIHFQKIYTAHPDADEIAVAPRFRQWVNWSVAREKVYEQGTSEEVIQLFSDYKKHILENSKELDDYLGSVYVMFPKLNFEGSNPDQAAIEEVVTIRDRHIKSGSAIIPALQMAVNEVAIKKRWIYPESAPTTTTYAAPASRPQTPYPDCVIRQTMTDADYAACGITPPSR